MELIPKSSARAGGTDTGLPTDPNLTMNANKCCSTCASHKPLEDFTKNKRYKDGLSHRCRPCDSVYQTSRRRAGGGIPWDRQIRPSVRDGRWGDVVVALKRKTAESDAGCWVWQSTLDSWGYGSVSCDERGGSRTTKAHRLMYRAANEGVDISPTQAIHHACAVRACVNPDHLQVVTAKENIAEMLERKGYRTRIAELEQALRELDEDHPCLLRGT